jgi:hypothetical protein
MINNDTATNFMTDFDGEDADIQQISDVLNNCNGHSANELNKVIQQLGLSPQSQSQQKTSTFLENKLYKEQEINIGLL